MTNQYPEIEKLNQEGDHTDFRVCKWDGDEWELLGTADIEHGIA